MNTKIQNDFISYLKNLFESRMFPYIVFALCVYIIYFRSAFFGLTALDDVALLTGDARRVFLSSPYSVISSFFQTIFNQQTADYFYRPLLTISWIIDTLIGKGSINIYHASNLVYHITSVCVLFNLLKNFKFSRNKAFAFSLFFAVIPVFSANVAWIPGRNDVILAIFIFTAFMFFVKFNDFNKTKYAFFAAFFFLLALFTKETAVVCVVLFPLYLILNRKNDFLRKIVLCLALCLLCTVLWHIARDPVTADMGTVKISLMLKKGLFASLAYLGKVFLPVNLKVLASWSGFDIALGSAIFVILGLLLYFSKGRNIKNVIFGALWFVLFLLPTYLQSENLIYDHRVYVSVFGLLLIINEIKISSKFRQPAVFFCVIYFLFFVSTDFINSLKFKDAGVFSSAASIETKAEVKPVYLYGLSLIDFEISEFFIRKSYKNIPEAQIAEYPEIHSVLAFFEWKRDNFDEAKRFIILANKKGNLYEPYSILSEILMKEGDIDGAIENMKTAFKMQPVKENYEYLKYLYNVKYGR